MSELGKLKSNLIKINWHSFCFGFAPYVPIIFLFFKANGLTFTQIGFISGAQWFAQLVLEVPTGVFADKFGRKIAMAIAAILLSFSYLLFFFGSDFAQFVIANMLFGAAYSFLVGSDISFIHDSLKSEGRQGEFSKYMGRYYFYFMFGAAVSSLVPTFLFPSNYRLPFAVAIPFALMSFFIVSSLYEPRVKSKNEKTEFWKHVSGSFNHITNQGGLIAIIAYYLVLMVSIQIFFRYMQFFLKDAGIPIGLNGIIFGVMIAICASMSSLAHYLQKSLGKNISLIALIFAVILPLLILSKSHNPLLVIVAFVFLELSYGYFRPLTDQYFHERVESHNRATVDSLKAFALDISLVILLPLCGYISDKVGVERMTFGLAIFALLVIVLPSFKLLRPKIAS